MKLIRFWSKETKFFRLRRIFRFPLCFVSDSISFFPQKLKDRILPQTNQTTHSFFKIEKGGRGSRTRHEQGFDQGTECCVG
jgi:hypothetical protein